MRPSVVIVSPACAADNNGNWQTAWRWRRLIAPRYAARIVQDWPDDRAAGDLLMLALHARRSAPAIGAWARQHGPQGLALALTGTDLYRDIALDAQARQSLELAQQLVVLQELGPQALEPRLRAKARVIFQSTTARQTLAKGRRGLRAVMVGHLREVKSPQTLFDAARLLRGEAGITIRHIGAASAPSWAEQARATQAECPGYRWLGAQSHAQARQAIQRAHVLVHTSAMEGGAHVIMEAVCSGTPVLASRVPGNEGMLGSGYAGYFPHADAARLASLLARCRQDQQEADGPEAGLLGQLRAQCAQRAPLFAPEAERAALYRLLQDLERRP
ncbi:MAG TPA: selenoneine biosynthesis selenosugar synthase SenB [Ramlibacter sp.]|nr:selenoneine biosynthesis selenosugar synthase SenB [Ramlibacter sp.]